MRSLSLDELKQWLFPLGGCPDTDDVGTLILTHDVEVETSYERLRQSRRHLLTEQDIVDRAAAARPSRNYIRLFLFCILVPLALIVSIPAWHAFTVRHREFIFGVLVGSLVQTAVIYLSRWTWDRYLWLKWFSHQ